ncbi:hypothetical protein N657DRAFT_639593, partial [Parathielavia appendiculata]
RPKNGSLDVNAPFEGATSSGIIDRDKTTKAKLRLWRARRLNVRPATYDKQSTREEN